MRSLQQARRARGRGGRTLSRVMTLALALACAVLLAACGGGSGSSSSTLSAEDARTQLDAMYDKISPTQETVDPDISVTETETLAEELPDIDTYDTPVKGSGDVVIEIMASGEKSGDGQDGWLNRVAENFNASGATVGGKSVGVTIRKVSSGEGYDYVRSGKYRPTAWSPSNAIYGSLMDAEGVSYEVATDRLVGNVAGFLLKQDKYDTLIETYGEATAATIAQAQTDGVITLGYTSPYTSATGMNMLMAIMESFSADDPTGTAATEKLQAFLDTNPPVLATTQAMRDSATNGLIDCMVMERQAFVNEPALTSGYVFVPAGVRHDSPVYALDATDEQRAALDAFLEYAAGDESQDLASQYGFNVDADYVSEATVLGGNQISYIQGLWKGGKDNAAPVVAAIVIDTSGSMQGKPLNQVKQACLAAVPYVNDGNYLGLVTYDSSVRMLMPIERFDTSNKALFKGAVNAMTTGGSTRTYDGLLTAAKMIEDVKDSEPSLANAKPMIFLLSDGRSNSGYTMSEAQAVIQALDIPVYTLAFGDSADTDELTKMSEINEATMSVVDEENVSYVLRNLLNTNL